MRLLARILGGAIAVSVLALAFLAYFVNSVDLETGAVFDGLGRRITDPPWWANWLLVSRYWAGIYWYVVDFIVFWGGLALSFFVASLGENGGDVGSD